MSRITSTSMQALVNVIVRDFLCQEGSVAVGTSAQPTSAKRFCSGVTYEELAAATGEPIREVNFELPLGVSVS